METAAKLIPASRIFQDMLDRVVLFARYHTIELKSPRELIRLLGSIKFLEAYAASKIKEKFGNETALTG